MHVSGNIMNLRDRLQNAKEERVNAAVCVRQQELQAPIERERFNMPADEYKRRMNATNEEIRALTAKMRA